MFCSASVKVEAGNTSFDARRLHSSGMRPKEEMFCPCLSCINYTVLHYPSFTVCPWGRTSVSPRSFKDYTEMLHPLRAVLNNITHKVGNGWVNTNQWTKQLMLGSYVNIMPSLSFQYDNRQAVH